MPLGRIPRDSKEPRPSSAELPDSQGGVGEDSPPSTTHTPLKNEPKPVFVAPPKPAELPILINDTFVVIPNFMLERLKMRLGPVPNFEQQVGELMLKALSNELGC
jgi:hypothetical protein